MEVDEAASVVSERASQRAPGETVYAKSEELLVAFYTHLPAEVKQILTSAGAPDVFIPLLRLIIFRLCARLLYG